MKYRAEVDGLRALAVVPVILFHAGFESFRGGFVGVDVFFVISGFLITTIIVEDIENNRFSIVDFYERRARRILPALFLVMLVCIPFAWMWMLPSQLKGFSQSLVAVCAFVSNFLFWQQSGYFAAAAEEKPLLHTWSLAVEEQYYLVFPVLLLLSWRFGKNRVFWLIVACAAVSLALSEWGWRNSPAATFYLAPTRVWELFAGSMAAFAARERGVQASDPLSAIGLAAIVFAVFAYDDGTPFPSVYALVPVAGVVLVLLYAGRGTLVARFLGAKILVGVGLISYSAYLWHFPMFAFAKVRFLGAQSDVTKLAIVAASLLLAIVSWKYVETPFRNRSLIRRSRFLVACGVLVSAFVAVGVWGHVTFGAFGGPAGNAGAFEAFAKAQDGYVWQLHETYSRPEFGPGDIKILIVGDSNSADLVNYLDAADTAGDLTYVALTIPLGCGNLYLPVAVLEKFHKKSRCTDADYLTIEKNKNLVREADWVFMASNWAPWEADLFEQSFERLKSEFGDKFWVVGTKHTVFGKTDLEQIMVSGSLKRTLAPLKSDVVDVNRTLNGVAGERFVDPTRYFCSEDLCTVVTDDGTVLQYDGFHLTPSGAQRIADGLASEGFMSKLRRSEP